ncbi:MAG TPA: ATP-binding cassette domain-containing protein [Solirubrobacteraceae bacterium]|nr:ATP-binding cassette domain-containing protein [Solirubrobacteraceae bacterium]
MGTLLSFSHVSKRYPDGRREIVVLDDVSFEIEEEGFVGLWGGRRAGKSTLLRMVAGIELPDAGTVRFLGRDVARMALTERERMLRGGVGLMSTGDWHPSQKERVVDHVALPLVSDGATLHEARKKARRVLHRVEMDSRADDFAITLSLAERTRVMLARALVHEPRVLLVDEPAAMPSLSERDELYALLQSVAREQCATLMVASEEMAPLRGAGVVMTIGDGELCSTEESGTVVPFPQRRANPSEHLGS